MEQCLIRCAAAEDYGCVEAIMKEVQKLHVTWRPDIYREADTVLPEESFRRMVKAGTFLVAEQNNTVVGILSYVYRHVESDKQVTREVLFVEDLAVKEEYRGNGIGSQLLQFLKDKVRREHLDGLELQVNAKNLPAMEMYEKNGFTPKSINMELL